jgi:hypothetical protein
VVRWESRLESPGPGMGILRLARRRRSQKANFKNFRASRRSLLSVKLKIPNYFVSLNVK